MSDTPRFNLAAQVSKSAADSLMPPLKLTRAQLSALEWLPSDGSVRQTEKGASSGLTSLHCIDRRNPLCQWVPAHSKTERTGWRLTEHGIALKRTLKKEASANVS